MNANMAFQLLQLANVHSGLNTPDIIERAKAFREFVEGRDGDPVSNAEIPQKFTVHTVPGVDPGTKRARRTKEQMAADAAAEAPMTTPQAAAVTAKRVVEPKATYTELHNTMCKLVAAKGGAAGSAVLAQFGIKAPPGSAKELQPEQYAECIELLQSALEEDAGGLA